MSSILGLVTCDHHMHMWTINPEFSGDVDDTGPALGEASPNFLLLGVHPESWSEKAWQCSSHCRFQAGTERRTSTEVGKKIGGLAIYIRVSACNLRSLANSMYISSESIPNHHLYNFNSCT